jgi:hypothetical protein
MDIQSRLHLVSVIKSSENITKEIIEKLINQIRFLERKAIVEFRRKLLREKIIKYYDNMTNHDEEEITAEGCTSIEFLMNNCNTAFCSDLKLTEHRMSNLTLSINSPWDPHSNFINNTNSYSSSQSEFQTADKQTPMSISQYSPMQVDEIYWEINIYKSSKIYDSKLFNFAGIYWNLSIGMNKNESYNRDFYFLHISPAEKIKDEAKLMIEFRIWKCSSIVYSRKSTRDLVFYPSEEKVNGLDRFLSSMEMNSMVEDGKLLMSVVLSTDIGPSGELIGCSSPFNIVLSPHF